MAVKLRGVALLTVLLLVAVLLVMACAFLTRQASHYRGAVLARERTVARGLAEAGLEATRLKLWKDPFFPPQTSPEQTFYVAEEALREGTYLVTVDRRPGALLYVTVVGRTARAEVTLHAEMDVAPRSRAEPTLENPFLGDWVRVW